MAWGKAKPHGFPCRRTKFLFAATGPAIFTVWGAGMLLTYRAATAAPGVVWGVLDALRAGPGSQVASGAAAEAAAYVAQKSGAGMLVGIIADLLGGAGGGKIATGMATGATGAAKGMAAEGAKAATRAERAADALEEAARHGADGAADAKAALRGGTAGADGLSFATPREQATWMSNKAVAAHRADADGVLDIGGMKVVFGARTADGQWERVNELFKHVSIDELEKAVTRGRADADTLNVWFASRAAEPPYPGAPARARLRAVCSGTINGRPVVTGRDGSPAFGQGGPDERPFIGRNQKAVAPEKLGQGPTLISEEAIALGKKENPNGVKFPNDMMSNAHAEVAFMQQAHEAGLLKAGDALTIPVAGTAVCRHCQEHLPLMAKTIGIRSMFVIDKFIDKIYYWHSGMERLELLK